MMAGIQIQWHGEKAYATCTACGRLVQLNKTLFGDLHICATACEQVGRHLDVQTRRCGPFWARRTETFCAKCDEVDRS